MHEVRRPPAPAGDGDASPAVRVPHPMLRLRDVLPASAEGRTVCHKSWPDILPPRL